MGVVKDKAMVVVIKQAIDKIKENPDENMPKLVEIIKKVDKNNMWAKQYEFVERISKDKDNNWNHYIRNILDDVDRYTR